MELLLKQKPSVTGSKIRINFVFLPFYEQAIERLLTASRWDDTSY